jgi:F-type H+-transporting ATPase subunit epsilon
MNQAPLVLQIITPDGHSLRKTGIDVVVLRRRELRFELGSEVAVFPSHAPLLIRIPAAPVRYRQGNRTFYLAVGGGFAEIRANEVLVVTPRFAAIPADDPEPAVRARLISEQWQSEHREFQREMVGYT